MYAARIAFEQQKAERFLDVGEHAVRARLRDIDRFGRLMQIARIVERDEQCEMLELHAIDERTLRDVLVHSAIRVMQRNKVRRLIRFCDRPIPITDCRVIGRRIIVAAQRVPNTGIH